MKGTVSALKLVTVIFISANGLKDCTFSLSQHPDAGKLPHIALHHRGVYSKVIPEHGVIRVPSMRNITFTCSSCASKNTLKHLGTDSIEVTCRDSALHYGDRKINFYDEIVCSKTVCNTVEDIGFCESGRLLSIGYKVEQTRLTDIEACYDMDRWITLYTKHIIYGYGLSGSYQMARVGFKKDMIPNTLIPDAYLQTNEDEALRKCTNSDEFRITNRTYLARGHLSPQADFVDPASQVSSYQYSNVVPQWQSINNGNWKAVEIDVRKFSELSSADQLQKTKSEVTVITGTYGVLELNHTEIYLMEGNHLPVPKYLWKLVYAPWSQLAIVLVVSNNPYSDQNELLCNQNVCGPYGWEGRAKAKSYQDLHKGRVHCCDYLEFKRRVPYAPRLDVAGVLSGPKKKT